jgi:quercetin dioxygenase-like cupin family protein
MDVMNLNNKKDTKVASYPYKGKRLEVKDVWIRWLTQAGPEDSPEYGLRFFTVGPGGHIPIHNHFYVQTMYILSGRMEVTSYDAKTDEKVQEKITGPGDFIFIPSMEAHSMINLSNTENATFLCCIANVYEDETI